MGNQHSTSHTSIKPRKNVHWKSAGRPAVPGKPEIIPIVSEDEPNAITLRWAPATHDGGAPLQGYQVECNRLGSAEWVRTSPPVVARPELVLTGLEPPHRYQFRVAAQNAVGHSDYSELSDVLTVSGDRGPQHPPAFHQQLHDITVLENDSTEFRVSFSGAPPPVVAWFKDDYEIFSSRRTAITTNDSTSVLVFHQTLASDEGEIKCTVTNRAGHAVTKARLSLEAAPKLRYPRQYEDGLLYEINETIFLKTTIVGKPTPTIEWRHDGQPIVNQRVDITNTPKFSILKIHSAQRSDRGEYQIHASNSIGEDTAAFLVTVTAPPDAPRRPCVARQVDKSVTLNWEPPEDDGGCRIGNYVVEYYRTGWNVWLKATTSRKSNVTLFDLIEGSEYRFRVKAESPYGMSAPSVESAPIRIPGRAVDMEFLAVEARIITEVLTREDGEEPQVSPAPRRKRQSQEAPGALAPVTNRAVADSLQTHNGSNEFMLVLYPDNTAAVKAENRKSFQLDLEEALSPPPLSLSAPELSSRCSAPFKPLRYAVSSTELLHEQAMARFYKAVELEERKTKETTNKIEHNIPYTSPGSQPQNSQAKHEIVDPVKTPEIFIKTDSIEDREFKYSSRQTSQDSDGFDSINKWQHMSFDEDYTASTVSSEEDFTDDVSLNGDVDRSQYSHEEETYNPRDKLARPNSQLGGTIEEVDESEGEAPAPLPLPDPKFVPKPILKRRESDVPEFKLSKNIAMTRPRDEPIAAEKTKVEGKAKESPKEEKMTLFKKFTKMPVQKPFPFPKILTKKELAKPKQNSTSITDEKNIIPKTKNKVQKIEDKISDEGRTVIDYYGSIVKEFGSQKKPAVPIYLNTDDLKIVAEKQQQELKVKAKEQKKVVKTKKSVVSKSSVNKVTANKLKPLNPNEKCKPQLKMNKNRLENNDKTVSQQHDICINKGIQQVVLKTTERATIVIPINYKELEEKAKVNVRSAIDYMVDLCLLLLAFWVYFFKDERLAIPFLILIIYRQLQQTLLDLPEWVKNHTPSWLKKTS